MSSSDYFVLNTTKDGEGRVLVDSVASDGAVRRAPYNVERVYYVRTSQSAAEVRSIVAKLAQVQPESIRCREVRDPGWVEVSYVHAFRLDIGAMDERFNEVLTLSKDATERLWLMGGIGASRWHRRDGAPLPQPRTSPIKTAFAVAVYGRRAALTTIDIESKQVVGEAEVISAADEKQCLDDVKARLCASRRVVVVVLHQPAILKALAAPAVVCIDVYDAIELLGIAKNIKSLYQLCRLCGDEIADDADLVAVLACPESERALRVACAAVARLFLERSVLTSAMELSQRTGIPIARLFDTRRMTLVNMMMLKLAVDNDCVPTPSAAGPRVTDGCGGGLVLSPMRGVHDAGPFALLDFASAYPSAIIEQQLCWHSSAPLLPQLMSELREARRAASDDGVKAALKLLANAVYGCLYTASTAGSRFVLDDATSVGALCAARCREALRHAAALAASLGIEVLYGVTDSLLVRADRAAALKLAGAASNGHVRMDLKETYARVVVFNSTSYIGVGDDGEVLHAAGIVDWNDCDWLARHLRTALANNADVASAVARARAELLSNRASREWCARELVRFASSTADRVPLIGETRHAGEALHAALPPVDDAVVGWYVNSLSKRLHSRRKIRDDTTTVVASAAPAEAAETAAVSGVVTGRSGRVRFGAIAAAPAASGGAMREASKLIDIEDLHSNGPLPLCIRQHVDSRYPSEYHHQMHLFRGLRGLGFSHAATESFMLATSPSQDKHRERIKKLHGFEKVAAKAYEASVEGYKKHQVPEADARERASCYPNCKTLIGEHVCPYAADRDSLVATLRDNALDNAAIGKIVEIAHRKKLYREACVQELRCRAKRDIAFSPPNHARDYVKAAVAARQLESRHKRKAVQEAAEEAEEEDVEDGEAEENDASDKLEEEEEDESSIDEDGDGSDDDDDNCE